MGASDRGGLGVSGFTIGRRHQATLSVERKQSGRFYCGSIGEIVLIGKVAFFGELCDKIASA